jgi:hypothetical protein
VIDPMLMSSAFANLWHSLFPPPKRDFDIRSPRMRELIDRHAKLGHYEFQRNDSTGYLFHEPTAETLSTIHTALTNKTFTPNDDQLYISDSSQGAVKYLTFAELMAKRPDYLENGGKPITINCQGCGAPLKSLRGDCEYCGRHYL